MSLNRIKCECCGCPTLCYDWEHSITATVSGASSACCCVIANVTDQAMTFNGDFGEGSCFYQASWYDGGASTFLRVECFDGEWKATLTIPSKAECDPACTDTPFDTWVGTIPRTDPLTPAGTYSLDWVSGTDCAGETPLTLVLT